jgi:hypothetical protein
MGLDVTKHRSNYKNCGSTKIVRRHKMTAVKTHSMALKDGDGTKIDIETLNPASSISAWVCRLTFLKSGQSLAVHLNNEEAVKLGTALFQIVAEKTA